MSLNSIIMCVADQLYLPEKHSDGAVCRDLKISEAISLAPGQIVLAPTGVKIACPEGWHCKIYARSGLPIKSWLMLANGVGVVDNDYRGEFFLQLYNFTQNNVTYPVGTRLGQFEIVPYFLPQQAHALVMPAIEIIVDPDVFEQFDQHYPTGRGIWGFHSTGR